MPDINTGIRKTVALLNAHRFVTTDSGDGETRDHDCDREFGYAVVRLQDYQHLENSTDAIAVLLAERGVVIGSLVGQVHVQGNYCPTDKCRLVDIMGIHDRMLTKEP